MNAPLARLISYTQGFRRDYLLASLCSVLNKIFDIAPEVLIGVAIDVVVKRESSWVARFGIVDVHHQLMALAVITFFIWFFESLFEYLHMILWRNLAQKIQHAFRIDCYAHVQVLDVAYFEEQKSGNLVAIMNDDVNQLERFLDGGANALLQTATVVVVIGGIFFCLAPTVAIWSMIPIPIILFGAFYYKSKAEPIYAKVREQAGDLASRLTSNMAGMLTIKSQTAENYEVERLRKQSQSYLAANAGAIRVSSAFVPIIRMAVLAGFLATLVIGGLKALSGELPVGSFGVLVFLTQRLLWPMTGLAATVDLYQRAMASVDRIINLLETKIVVRSGARELTQEVASGPIEFRGINFSYATRPHVLHNINLSLPAGQMIALVGSTGSGKSTIAKLLLRFYEPTLGAITVSGVDLPEFSLQSLRQRIGFVGQENFLFDGTIFENIAYGQPQAERNAVLAAAQAAEAMEFIDKLPQGMDTLVGERGQKLSGGQRQRLAIARALLKNPAILILDEATSAVDNETEQLIQRSLLQIAKHRTVLVIAHRLSTIRNAQCIHVISRGSIVESGTHDQLLAHNQQYAHLWRIQTGDLQA